VIVIITLFIIDQEDCPDKDRIWEDDGNVGVDRRQSWTVSPQSIVVVLPRAEVVVNY